MPRPGSHSLTTALMTAAAALLITPATSPGQETQKKAAAPGDPQPPSVEDLFTKDPEVDVKQMIDELKPKLDEIGKRQAEIADEMTRMAVLQLISPPSPSGSRGTYSDGIRNYLTWSERRMGHRLAVTKDADSRNKLLAQEVARLRELEKLFRQVGEFGARAVTPTTLMELEYQRLGLESRLVTPDSP